MPASQAIAAEQARHIHHHMLGNTISNCLSAFGVAAIFWEAETAAYVATWVAAIVLHTIGTIAGWMALRNNAFAPATVRRVLHFSILVAALSSIFWSIGLYLFLPATGLTRELAFFLGTVLAGTMSVFSFGSYYPSFLAAFLPFALTTLFITGTRQASTPMLFLAVLIFIPAMLAYAWRFTRVLLESLRLRFENLDLVDQLTVQKESAEQANRAKSVFLAKISHELRTPMHAVLGYLDLALRERIGPTVARQLNTARTAGQQLVSQINDLLDYARAEHALLKLEPASTSLHALAAHLKERAGLLARERGNRFELVLAPDLPHWIWIDGGRLEQALMALLNNAMRYTNEGQVRLRIALASAPQEHEIALRFAVEDTGRGIAPEALARIFKTFERDAGDADGLGLGLPIAQQLLDLMGSRLEVESQVGHGSRFGFTLLVRGADESQAVRAPDLDLFTGYEGRTRQVLVLDDNPINRRYLEELLGDLGFDVRSFAAVSAAIAYLAALNPAPEACPDLCIVDQHLEEHETGWDFVLALRDTPSLPSAMRGCAVLMLSATEALPPAGWNLAHGIDRHLLKPVQQQLLLQTVGEMIGLEWTMPARAETAADASAGAGTSATPQAWQELIEAADSGALSALEDWLRSYPALSAEGSRLQRLVEALDFAGIADHAKSQALARMPQ